MRGLRPLSWNPAWFHRGASLWCLAAKIAYVATSRVGAVVKRLAGASEDSRVRIWTLQQATVELAREQFDLAAEDARSLMLPANPGSLEQRQHTSLALRWCPECLSSWFHCVKFQDRRVRLCPWHRVRLLDACPHCARAVDPLGLPWRCSHCGNSLVDDPEHWLSGLKRPPGHDGRWPSRVPTSLLGYQELKHGVRCLPDVAGDELLTAAHRRGLEYWQLAQLYESSAALWDSVLCQHKSCAFKEKYGYQTQHFNLEFACPVAAAGIAVFSQMSLPHSLTGEWPNSRVIASAYQTLPPPGTVPLEVRKALLRELPRAWLADALMVFGEAARVGRTSARWEPHPAAFQAKALTTRGSNGAQIVTKRPESWLAATAAFSAEMCPNGKATSADLSGLKLLLV